MAAKFKTKAPKCGRTIKVYDKSFMVEGEATPFRLYERVPCDMIGMLKDLLDDVYEQGKSDKAKEIKKALEIE